MKKLLLAFLTVMSPLLANPSDRITLDGAEGKPGQGKHIVLLCGDHEYRSEEYLPMMAQILSSHHGFKTTTLFAQNEKGEVDPGSNSMPGLDILKEADAIILGLRFRHWSDADFNHFNDALQAGVPFLSTRTSTHAFKTSNKKWKKFSFNSKEEGWEGGFGRQVLGETWVNHHGHHGVQGTKTVPKKGQENHPILRGVGSIYAPTDVYGAAPLDPEDLLLDGLVTETLLPGAKPVEGEKNNPPMPVAWTKLYKNTSGKTNKVFTTTLGSGIDFLDENLRRLMVNATYWATGLEVPEKASVEMVKAYTPQHFKGGKWRTGMKPVDFLELKESPFTLPHLEKEAVKK